jgi:hypothetical protein
MKNKTPRKSRSGGGKTFWKAPFLGVLLIVAFLSGGGKTLPCSAAKPGVQASAQTSDGWIKLATHACGES